MEIKQFKQAFSVCKVADVAAVNLTQPFVFAAHTDEEISLVCPSTAVPSDTTERDDGWKLMRIQGVLDFSLIGILADISAILAAGKIGIFAISTFNTDYILVKAENYAKALSCLADKGYTIVS